MKNFISKILDQPTQQSVFKFVPQIKISSKSTLHLEIEPNDPHTASNIVINAFISKTNRTIVPIKVQWSRYKFKSDQQFIIEKIPSVTGNTYMCQPSDLGSIVQAKVKCLDNTIGGQAQATIGPIRIDSMLKRLIDGALYNQSLLSQVIVVEGEYKFNINLRLGKNIMQLIQIDSNQKLTMPYTFSQPKVQLSPKDPCKVYLRFEQDTNNTVRNWLNKIGGGYQKNVQVMNQSSMSMKIPHSNASSLSTKTKFFQKSPMHCVNKLSVRFLSRNSRDLFLFTLRAFICKEDMKNSIVLQKIQTLQALKSEQDYNKFLEYVSLKSQIIRLAQIAKNLQIDRDSKVKDINNMQQSISQMTLTYLKIIQEKSQQQHVDLQQSYSMISMKREEILGRRNFRELKKQNDTLKERIQDLNQQLQLQKFFKDKDNESMMLNQTSNPFMKKNISGIIEPNNQSYNFGGIDMNNSRQNMNDPAHKNMLQISKSYLKVLQQNKKLKAKSQYNKGNNKEGDGDQSRDIQNLLQSLHENEEYQRKLAQMQTVIENMKKQLKKLKDDKKTLELQNADLKLKISANEGLYLTGTPKISNPNLSNFKAEYSYYSRSSAQNNSMLSNSYISMNQSMTSEAELNLLQKKLIDLASLNTKFESQNTRLRKQRDYYRLLYEGQIAKSKIPKFMEPSRDQPLLSNKVQSLQQSNLLGQDQQNSVIMRLKEQKQKLQNEKNSLLKKIDSITRQSNAIIKSDGISEKKCQQLQRQNEKLMQQNERLEKTIQNIKNFHQLERKQLLNNSTNNNKTQPSNQSNQSNSGSQKQILATKQQQIQKLKKVNNNLLQELKDLRIQIQRKNDQNLGSSRVIELQNQLQIFKTYAKGGSMLSKTSQSPSTLLNTNNNRIIENQELLNQIGSLQKQNQRLKQQIVDLQLKTKTQTTTIQKLMTQLDEFHQSQLKSQSNSILQNSFNKKYLTPEKDSLQGGTQQYKKKIVQLEKQIELMRRNSQAFNRSRDLSMSMMGYDQQRIEIYKKQNQSLMLQNENLSNMCSKYAKDARQANIELNKLRQKMMKANKERYTLEGDV